MIPHTLQKPKEKNLVFDKLCSKGQGWSRDPRASQLYLLSIQLEAPREPPANMGVGRRLRRVPRAGPMAGVGDGRGYLEGFPVCQSCLHGQ